MSIKALIVIKNLVCLRKSLWFNKEIQKFEVFLKIQSF